MVEKNMMLTKRNGRWIALGIILSCEPATFYNMRPYTLFVFKSGKAEKHVFNFDAFAYYQCKNGIPMRIH